MSKVELKTISELLDKKFVVPLYQRGYRWETQQVKDLLEDIDEFIRRYASGAKKAEDKAAGSSVVAEADDFYCLQPLAVKEKVKDFKLFSKLYSELFQENKAEDTDVLLKARSLIENNVCWEVIDGQQRLTTIFIILHYLKVPQCFDIEFDRWKNEQENENGDLANVVSEIAKKIEQNDKYEDEGTIDRWHIFTTYKEIVEFFRVKNDVEKSKFRDALLNKVQFIWYESDEEDPVKVFTRLNIGKIALTNSELIKALFLNRSNFVGTDIEKIRLRQMEIASRWDEIETTLQNDEFRMFIHEQRFDEPTRIDFIFDLISDTRRLDEYMPIFKNMKEEDRDKKIGKDKFRTFRYFNEYFKSKEARCAADKDRITLIEQCWKEVDLLFAAFREWFEDLCFYHYVGFLVACDYPIKNIVCSWQKSSGTKENFVSWLKAEIVKKVQNCKDLRMSYQFEPNDPQRVQCRPLLLLHNIQCVINQNTNETAKYGIATFYKFPFHLFKAEKWNVEHIDSNTENSLDNEKDREEWLKSAWCFLRDEEVRKKIIEYFSSDVSDRDFEGLHKKVLGSVIQSDPLDDKGKNQIGNFVLLDESTNKSYGNAIFPVKKMILMGKTQGVQYQFKEKVENDILKGFEIVAEPLGSKTDIKWKTAFVPPVTLRAFLKAFNPVSNNPWSWDADDAKAYRSNIYETLKEFGVIDASKDANAIQ